MKYKIVSDSSSDLLSLEKVSYTAVPLHITVGSQEFVDDESVDLAKLERALSSHRGRSGTACPGEADWLRAFGDADVVFCITITSALSGCYNSALSAKREYEDKYPARHVHVIDSLSTGPEMVLIIEKLQELILSEKDENDILDEITDYTKHTHLLFSLETLTNLANNGRVSPAIAKLAGILGIRVIGQASSQGELQLLDKCRGEQCTLSGILRQLKNMGYRGGKIRISHNDNEKTALHLKTLIQENFPTTDIRILTTRALCSFYAEKGGILVGVEC